MAKYILLIESDDALCASLAEQLEFAGEYRVLCAGSAEAAETFVAGRRDLDAAVIGAGLSGTGGTDICRALRSAGVSGPVLALLAGPGEDATAGLKRAGASACLAGPVPLDALLARLRALLQEGDAATGTAFPVGGYMCRPDDRLLVDDTGNRSIRLTEKEVAILECLHRAGGRAVSRSVLLKEVWGYKDGVDTHTIATHIYRLRRKIEDDPSKPVVLATGDDGYRLAS